ncbi:MAG TPA: hypothetical protein IAA15_02710 [Candidatus Olsenella pullicola]|nr:hypothetical protein [Candidatus Olsenella pullicola]
MSTLSAARVASPTGEEDDCCEVVATSAGATLTLSGATAALGRHTFGCWARSEGPGSLSVAGGEGEPTSSSWARVERTFDAEGPDLVIAFGEPGTYHLYESKLEAGDFATGWTPAPEDVEDEVAGASASLSVAIDGISGRVSSAEGNISVLEQTAEGLEVTLGTVGSKADSAAAKADSAATSASNAAKTATNYLSFSSSGLCVGNYTGTLQGNVLLNSSGMQVRNGSTIYATYGASTVELGRNSTSSTVKFCAGSASVSAATNTATFNSSKRLIVGGSQGTDVGLGTSKTDIYGNIVRAYCGGAFRQLKPVYRLYNPYDKCYLETADSSEASSLVSQGWQQHSSNVFYAFK